MLYNRYYEGIYKYKTSCVKILKSNTVKTERPAAFQQIKNIKLNNIKSGKFFGISRSRLFQEFLFFYFTSVICVPFKWKVSFRLLCNFLKSSQDFLFNISIAFHQNLPQYLSNSAHANLPKITKVPKISIAISIIFPKFSTSLTPSILWIYRLIVAYFLNFKIKTVFLEILYICSEI